MAVPSLEWRTTTRSMRSCLARRRSASITTPQHTRIAPPLPHPPHPPLPPPLGMGPCRHDYPWAAWHTGLNGAIERGRAQMRASPGADVGQAQRVLVMHRTSAELHERGVSSTVAAHSDMHVKGHSRWAACGTWCAPQQGGMLLSSCRYSVRHAICTVHRAATCRLCRKRILRLRREPNRIETASHSQHS
jgi:hypothetical protein